MAKRVITEGMIFEASRKTDERQVEVVKVIKKDDEVVGYEIKFLNGKDEGKVKSILEKSFRSGWKLEEAPEVVEEEKPRKSRRTLKKDEEAQEVKKEKKAPGKREVARLFMKEKAEEFTKFFEREGYSVKVYSDRWQCLNLKDEKRTLAEVCIGSKAVAVYSHEELNDTSELKKKYKYRTLFDYEDEECSPASILSQLLDMWARVEKEREALKKARQEEKKRETKKPEKREVG